MGMHLIALLRALSRYIRTKKGSKETVVASLMQDKLREGKKCRVSGGLAALELSTLCLDALGLWLLSCYTKQSLQGVGRCAVIR